MWFLVPYRQIDINIRFYLVFCSLKLNKNRIGVDKSNDMWYNIYDEQSQNNNRNGFQFGFQKHIKKIKPLKNKGSKW